MSTPESIPLVKNIVDVNANVFESLKESAKNGTLEEYLSDKDISNLAYDAAQQDEKECLKILINQGVDLSVPVREKKTILNAIFDNVTNAEKFISKVLDSQVDLDKSNVYVLNFRLLRPEENKQMAVISNLCEATSDKTMINILQHPLLEIYLKNRWRANNLVYNLTAILHLISLAYAIITLTDAAINITEDSVVVEHIIIYISTPIFFVCRVILFWLICPPRLNKYETWMNLMATIFLLATGIIIIPSYDSATLKSKPTCVKVAFTLAFSGLATEMTISIGRINPYGYYITMYGVVLKKIVKLLLLYIYIFSYFAITSFSIIQYGRKNNDTSIYQNLVNIFTMLVGQFDYSKIVDTELATDVRVFKVISVIFVVLNSIVLMNLVIGLAVEDIHTLRQETHARMLQKQAEFLSRIEQITFFRKFDFLKPFQINETVRVGRSIKTMKHSSRLENALLKIVKKKKKKMNNLQSHDWNHGGSINRREHSLYRQCFRCGTSRPLARTTL